MRVLLSQLYHRCSARSAYCVGKLAGSSNANPNASANANASANVNVNANANANTNAHCVIRGVVLLDTGGAIFCSQIRLQAAE